MKHNCLDETVLQWEESALQGGLAKTTFSLFENRRGTLSLTDEAKLVNWPKLENKGPLAFGRYAADLRREVWQKRPDLIMPLT